MSNIQELIENYKPDHQRLASLANVKLVLLVGISGAGKDTIKQKLFSTGEYDNFISHTTRQPRENNGVSEQDGVDYHFITLDEAMGMLQRGEFIEAKEYAGNIYGTSLAGLESVHDSGKVALNDVEVQGVAEYKQLLPGTIAIFVLPPDYDEWQRRLRQRYDDDEFATVWPGRRQAAIRELEFALSVPYYHFVINDDLDSTIESVTKITQSQDKFHRKDDEARLAARDILRSIETDE